MKKQTSSIKWVIWALAALFYFYEYILRISPTVMVSDLMQSFGVTASMIGVITAFFLYAYAPMQLFVGVLMDRYGLKLLITVSCITSGLGALLFGLANTVWFLKVGRLFIGFGAAFAFIGLAYICTHWFSQKRGALLLGIGNSIAMLGAVCGTAPLAILINTTGWRQAMIGLGIAGFVFAFIMFLLVNKAETPEDEVKSKLSFKHLLKDLKLLVKNRHTWINGMVAVLFYATTTAFGGLWGVPFLEASFNLTTTEASSCISMIFIGWLVGGPCVGYISDKLKKRKPIISCGIFFTFLSVLSIIYFENLSLSMIYILIFLIGFFSAAELLNFTLSVEINPKKVKGSAIALTNSLVAFGGSLFQPVAGFLLDHHWDGKIVDGIRIYSAGDYRSALTILPICLFLALILSFVVKEKRHDETTLTKPLS